jgi:hypothetical protein
MAVLAEQPRHRQTELNSIQGLHENVIGLRANGSGVIFGASTGSHEDDRYPMQIAVGFDGAAQVVAAHVRHLEVDDHGCGLLSPRDFERFDSGRRRKDDPQAREEDRSELSD